MILEFDAGNTRIKWRLVRETPEGLFKQAEGSVLGGGELSSVFADLALQLDKLAFSEIQSLNVSSVRGKQFDSLFAAWLMSEWQVKPEFAKVERVCAGLTSSYADVSKMGVDRWLAMLAAFNEAKAACCIVDCGSAITLDVINAQGQHQGGYIVPGFHLMRESLTRKSHALNIADSQWGSTQFGLNTGEAINNGISAMVLGLLEGVYHEIKADAAHVDWFVTGGDASLVSPLLVWKHKVVPDLVMDGLAISMA